VHINPEAGARASIRSTTARPSHRHVKTAGAEAGARQVRLRRRLRRRAARRGEVARQGAHLLVPLGAASLGSEEPAAGALAALQRAQAQGREHPRVSAVELDRAGHLAVHPPENIPIVPLYFAAERPVVERDGTLIMVDDERMPLEAGRAPQLRKVRFRTLGCYPLTGAIESEADTLPEIIQEMLLPAPRAPGPRDRPRRPPPRWRRRSRKGYF
jgi:hypothetical protein